MGKTKLGSGFKKLSGFTLAEVIITLIVIGVVAGLAMQPLLQTAHNKEYFIGFRDTYTILSRNAKEIIVDNKFSMARALGFNSDSAMNEMCSRMQCTLKCNAYSKPGVCWHDGASSWKNLNGNNGWLNASSMSRFVLSSGQMVAIDLTSPTCQGNNFRINNSNVHCGWAIVDTNGFNAPNQAGRDIFTFAITKFGIYSLGIDGNYDNSNNPITPKSRCDSMISLPENGVSCGARLLKEGVMDY